MKNQFLLDIGAVVEMKRSHMALSSTGTRLAFITFPLVHGPWRKKEPNE